MGLLSKNGIMQRDQIKYYENLRDQVNLIKDSLDAVLTKLDVDAGVTDTDYQSKHGKGGSDAAKLDAVALTLDV